MCACVGLVLCYLPWQVEVTCITAGRHHYVTAGHTVLTKSARLHDCTAQLPSCMTSNSYDKAEKKKMNVNNVAARVISKHVLHVKQQW